MVAIQISNPEVRGTLPAALANFIHLSSLHLASTKISGKLKIIASMKNLQHLDLSGTEVAGDIQALQEVQKLQHINLHSTRVAGDIQVFQALVQLKSLDLGNTQVVGDIQAFQATQSLDSLRLVATQVSGDISAFKATKDLTVLNLDLSHIFGDVQVFQATKSLMELSLKSTDVTGDIKVFENTNGLEYFDLASTKVTGDIQVLNTTGQLKVVHLPNTRVHGDIAVFSSTDTSELTSLSMGNSAVFGNISALKSADKLSEVVFASTQVGGDIRVFESKPGLLAVICSSTQVTGDVQVFENKERLMFLDLSFTQVPGDVKVFVGNQQLQILKLASAPVFGDVGVLATSEQNGFSVLDLSFTQVVGNIWVFQNAWHLKELYLGGTKVTGSIEGIVSWSQAQVVDLSDTLVTGRLTKRWRGCCRHLRILKLSGSRVQFVPNGDDLINLMNLQQLKNPNLALLPALTTLEVSGCRLNCHLQDLLLPLGACEHVGTIKAVKSGLTGELPNLDPMPPTIVETGIFLAQRSSLASSLEFIDLSGNNLSYIAAVPGASQTLVLAGNQQPLRLAKDALSKALKHGVFVDLRGTQLHDQTNREAQILLQENVMRNTSQRIYSRPERGYSCYDLDRNSTTLQVSPPDFLPDEWCACMAGWHGMGTRCTKCPENTFSEELNTDTCKECPVNTTTDKDGSTSMWDCKCEAGELHALNGSHLCGCPEGFASSGVSCVNCAGLHLNCSDRFSDVASEDPDAGFARLVLKAEEAYECFPPAKLRCPGRNGSGLGCAPGYQGSLCMGCSEGHFSSGRSCVECSGKGLPSWLIKMGLALLLFFLFLIATFIIAHTVYSWHPGQHAQEWLNYIQTCIFPPGVLGSLQQKLLKGQLPVLLQMCQLWSVLAALAHGEDSRAASWQFPELPYVQRFQFTLGSFRELLYLQCYLGGFQVRFVLALITPVVPLLLLLCCVILELFRRGAGVHAGLKILTVFFIGGASTCMALRSCQRFDAGGEKLEDFAFLRQLPDLPCDADWPEHHWVFAVFWPCAVCYGILIPCFLFYLYTWQHIVLRYNRMPMEIKGNKGENQLAVGFQDINLDRRLVATSVAYVALTQHGAVCVQLRGGQGIITLLDHPSQTIELDVDSSNMRFKNESEKLQHHAITEMLLEHCILSEVGKTDRLLEGAKETLLKYATCRDLWMEVVLKLVAVAVVQVVSAAQVASSADENDFLISLGKVMAINLGMASTVWMVRPYAHPQVNDLQCFCFLCLTASALGFRLHMAWLSRCALLAPLLLAAGQAALQPDSPESLARRLWEDLVIDGVPQGSAKTSVLSRRHSLDVSLSLERE